MAIVLGENRYGKAEVRLVRVDRDGDRHGVTDLNVSVALSGDMTDTHLTGANDKVLATDTQKNTVFAFARDGIGAIESFAARLARHFVDSQPSIHRARVRIEQYTWHRLGPHSFSRAGDGTRTAVVTYDGSRAWTVSGLADLTVLNSTDSEFWGFPRDAYTTLQETKDRILATAVTASWRHTGDDVDWDASHATARDSLLTAFAGTYSLSLQQTLYAMGERALNAREEICEVRLAMPNKHHFLVDMSTWGLDNPNEVWYAADRPYGLIEASIIRDDLPPAPEAWLGVKGFI